MAVCPSDVRGKSIPVATIKQIISQIYYQGYDIDILSIQDASGYTCYEYLITCQGHVISESDDNYCHPDDALDQAHMSFAYDLPEHAEDLIFLRKRKQIQSIIEFEGYMIAITDEVTVSKPGRDERSFTRQDLQTNDLGSFWRDPTRAIIDWYEASASNPQQSIS